MAGIKGIWQMTWGSFEPVLKSRAWLALVCLPALVGLGVPVDAAAETAAAQPSSPAAAVGRVLGMVLFGYLVLKWANRKKDRGDDEPQGFLGLRVKPWVV